MIIKHSHELALAIVQSSSPDLSIEDKIKLYEDARSVIKKHNEPQIEAENKRLAENQEAYLKAFGR